MIKQLERRIRALEEKMERLQPVRSPDTLTNQTSRGISRRPIPRTAKSGTGTGQGRWA